MAVLMVARAAVASVMLERSLTDPAVPPPKSGEAYVFEVPVSDVATLLPVVPRANAVNTIEVGLASADADAFATVGLPYVAPAPLPPFTALARLVRLAASVAPTRTSLAVGVLLRAVTKV